MKINIVTNLKAMGLRVDYDLLCAFLAERGHDVYGVQFDEPSEHEADLNINLEVVPRHHLALAPEQWLFVNPEWLKESFVPLVREHFSKILCKTHDAERICLELFDKDRVVYTGFMVRDQMDATIPRERKFLHIGGNSSLRNTQAIINAWERMENPYPLTIVSKKFCSPVPGIEFYEEVTEQELKELQNSHLFHLYPSGYEGFGHALHEAQSVGAILLTTLAPPMEEFDAPFYVRTMATTNYNYGIVQEVPAEGIKSTADSMWGLSFEEDFQSSFFKHARGRFEGNNKRFAELFGEVIDGHRTGVYSRDSRRSILEASSGERRIAILGNFAASYTTESELSWSFQYIGCSVIELQEDRVKPKEVVRECLSNNVDLLLWIHTHGWPSIDTPELNALRSSGIKTASFHLDRFWGLNALDGREDSIGVHPFWKTDFVFTADGGNQERFKERGVNHFWLPPGVVERGVHYGRPRHEFMCDVAFVGSRNYHPEYPFRGELIDWLEKTYGSRFKLITGVRESDLNDAYASAKVVVGDSCFAGAPYYWSDRVPETIGRGGMLIHPRSEGMSWHLCDSFADMQDNDFGSYALAIEYFLRSPEIRRGQVRRGMEWVRQHETYSQRALQILQTVGLVETPQNRFLASMRRDSTSETLSEAARVYVNEIEPTQKIAEQPWKLSALFRRMLLGL